METETFNQDKFVPVCSFFRTNGSSKYLTQMKQASYLYEINRKGVVRAIENKHVMTWHRMANKYKRYTLNVLKKRKKRIRWNIMFHRLLMLTFHPVANPDDMDVEHIKDDLDSDGFKSNDLTNLKWMTQKEHRGQKRKRFIANNGQKKPVEQYDLVTGKTLQTFASASDAGSLLKLHVTSILKVCRGYRYKSTGGYGWRYTQTFLASQKHKQGELWKSFHNKEVSNFGRVKAEKGLISYGSLRHDTNPYRKIRYLDNKKNREKRLHQVVLKLFGQDKIKAFEKQQPGLAWTPDHIDGNAEHNCIANLRPASRSQQAKNRHHVEATTCSFCDFFT